MGQGSKEIGLGLGFVVGGVGEDKASAETKGVAGGLHGVAAGGDVVHEIGLAERQGFAGSGDVVLVGRDWAKRVLVPVALALNWLRSGYRLGDLRAGGVVRYGVGQLGVGLGVSPAVGDGDEPARGFDESGHGGACGVKVGCAALRVFDGVGDAADSGARDAKNTARRQTPPNPWGPKS